MGSFFFFGTIIRHQRHKCVNFLISCERRRLQESWKWIHERTVGRCRLRWGGGSLESLLWCYLVRQRTRNGRGQGDDLRQRTWPSQERPHHAFKLIHYIILRPISGIIMLQYMSHIMVTKSCCVKTYYEFVTVDGASKIPVDTIHLIRNFQNHWATSRQLNGCKIETDNRMPRTSITNGSKRPLVAWDKSHQMAILSFV